jgi:pyridoxamine--pyruvate transaminase
MYSLESVLNQTLAVGMERFVDRQQTIARACREGVKALRLELWPAREKIAAACVTAVRVPEGIDDAKLRGTMRHRYGVMISPGYGELQGQLFRLGHMGPAQAHPTVLAAQLAVLERSLADLGFPVQLGVGVGAAMAALEGWDDEGHG